MTAAPDYDHLHHLAGRLSPHQAKWLPAASDPELAPAEPERQDAPRRRLPVTGIWQSGRGDLAERHDEIIRGRLKPPA